MKFLTTALLSLVVTVCVAKDQGSPAEVSLQGAETLVFVHGAHLTKAAWSDVRDVLQADGLQTLAVDLPGRGSTDNANAITLEYSALALCSAIKKIAGPIVFVAHSQGGAVVNQSLSLCPRDNIKSIVYLAAVAPLNGEKPFSLLSQADESNYFKVVRYDEPSGWMLLTDKELFVSIFSNSASPKVKQTIMAQAVNEPAIIAEGVIKLRAEYFASLDKFYIYTVADQVISLASQQAIAATIKPKKELVLESGHLPMISSPIRLAAAIQSLLN
ncbi:hypothetical protein A9Q82_09490 [Cycloclasticus sp. 46_120_T64]|nr:hypothetical protein A9Q82_09490 [Cycloclasticus sp. 46_120_T64]